MFCGYGRISYRRADAAPADGSDKAGRLGKSGVTPFMKRFRLSVIICAAGRSERMGGTDKIGYVLGDRPVYRWAVETFLAYGPTVRVVVAVPPEKLAAFAEQGTEDPRLIFCAGGLTRWETVSMAAALAGDADLIAVHDGARPFVDAQLIDTVCHAALQYGGAVPALAVTDTIHVAEDGFAVETPERKKLYAAQTPQIFTASAFETLMRYVEVGGLAPTDECSAAIACGIACRLVPGCMENLKITTAADLLTAERIAGRDGVYENRTRI